MIIDTTNMGDREVQRLGHADDVDVRPATGAFKGQNHRLNMQRRPAVHPMATSSSISGASPASVRNPSRPSWSNGPSRKSAKCPRRRPR